MRTFLNNLPVNKAEEGGFKSSRLSCLLLVCVWEVSVKLPWFLRANFYSFKIYIMDLYPTFLLNGDPKQLTSFSSLPFYPCNNSCVVGYLNLLSLFELCFSTTESPQSRATQNSHSTLLFPKVGKSRGSTVESFYLYSFTSMNDAVVKIASMV